MRTNCEVWLNNTFKNPKSEDINLGYLFITIIYTGSTLKLFENDYYFAVTFPATEFSNN